MGSALRSPWRADPLPVRALLAEGDFDALEARFAAARAGGDGHEATVLLRALEHLTPAEHGGLEAWLRERPDSVAARLALAQRELERAWEARGAGYAFTVSADAGRAMRAHLERSVALAAEAAERDPRWLDAHRLQIECALLLGDRALAQRAFRAALAVDPTHYGVWSAYQRLFQRGWGGSYEEQEEIARAAQAHAESNPRLRALLAGADLDRAHDLHVAGRHAEALAAYDRVLVHRDDGCVRARRAALRAALDDLAGARAEVAAGLALDPHCPRLQAARARQCMTDHDFACMAEAAARALALDPSAPDHHELHAFAVWALENPAAARRRLARHPVQDWIERHRRWLYLHAFESAVAAALVLLGWYLARARRRRRKAAGPVPVLQLPLAPSPGGVEPSMLERLPRAGVRLLRAFLWFEVVRFGLYYDGRLVPADPQPLLLVEMAATAVALAGALAFAYGRRLGRPWLWKLWAVGYPAWTQWLAVGPHGFTWQQWSIWGFWHAILLPVYASLFLYGWSCQALWRGGLPGPGWRAPQRVRPAAAAAGRAGR